MKKASSLGIWILPLALLASGCGSGTDAPSASTTPQAPVQKKQVSHGGAAMPTDDSIPSGAARQDIPAPGAKATK